MIDIATDCEGPAHLNHPPNRSSTGAAGTLAPGTVCRAPVASGAPGPVDGRKAPTRDTVSDGFAVVIPCRNEQDTLAKCLTAVRAATRRTGWGGAEIVVVDDASTDSTREIALAHDVTLLKQTARQGPLAAWRRGLEATNAPVVIFTDADCEVDPGAFQFLLGAIATDRVGVVSGRSVPHAAGGRSSLPNRGARFSSLLIHQIKLRIDDHDFLPIGRLMAIRRSAWAVPASEVGICDRVTAICARLAGWRIAYVPGAVARYTPPSSFNSLRRDYLRTVRAPMQLQGLSPLPRRVVGRAFAAAFTRSPGDAMAWLLIRSGVLLSTLSHRRPSPSHFASWPDHQPVSH